MIPRRLKGKAWAAFGNVAPNYKSMDEFLQDLNFQFGNVFDTDTIRLQMRQCVQMPGKSVSEFSLRMQKLEQRLLALYEASNGLPPSTIEYHKERVQAEALENFLYGLRNPPEYRVVAKNPKTLREATNIAVFLEGKEKLRTGGNTVRFTHKRRETSDSDTDETSSDSTVASNSDLMKILSQIVLSQTANVRATTATKICSECQRIGHLANECNMTKMCKFCSRKGHDIGTCYRLLDMIDKGEVTPQSINQPKNILKDSHTSAEIVPALMSMLTMIPGLNNLRNDNYPNNNFNNYQSNNRNYRGFNNNNTGYRSYNNNARNGGYGNNGGNRGYNQNNSREYRNGNYSNRETYNNRRDNNGRNNSFRNQQYSSNSSRQENNNYNRNSSPNNG